MKNIRFIVSFIAVILLAACKPDTPELNLQVHTCAPIPFERASATCFVVNDQAYIFAGRDSAENLYNDLWRYIPATDSWDLIGTTPLIPRVNATACVESGKVYIGLGFNGKHTQDTSYLQDWWEYIPQTNTWTRLADYPNNYTDAATAFVGDGELYVGYGFRWNYRRDMFRYTIATNTWDSIDVHVAMHDYPLRSFGGTGCTCAKRHFMGTGYYRKSLNWWAELVNGDHWEERTPVPGKERTLAASTATDSYIYVIGGFHYGSTTTSGEVLRDIRRYTPQNDSWTYAAQLPEGLMNHVAFSIGKRVYIGLGENEEWKVSNKLYYLE